MIIAFKPEFVPHHLRALTLDNLLAIVDLERIRYRNFVNLRVLGSLVGSEKLLDRR